MTRRKKKVLCDISTYAILIFASFVVLLPMAWMVSTSLKEYSETVAVPPSFIPKKLTTESFSVIWTNYPFVSYFKNSFIVLLISTLISMIFSCLAGYGVSRFNFKGKGSFLTFLLITQMFPSIMMLIPFYKMMVSYGIVNTHLALILPYISFTVPFCTWMMMGYFNTISKELEESATIDGCNRVYAFVRIILPISLPGLIATAVYSFISGWNEYMFAMTLTTTESMKTVPVGIGMLVGEYRVLWNDMMAASIYAGVPVTIAFSFLQKYLISNLAAGATKG
jgi:multiple sugar transport system permease protein